MLREQANEHGGNPGDRLPPWPNWRLRLRLLRSPLSNVQNPKNSNHYHFASAGITRYKTAGQRMSLGSCLSRNEKLHRRLAGGGGKLAVTKPETPRASHCEATVDLGQWV